MMVDFCPGIEEGKEYHPCSTLQKRITTTGFIHYQHECLGLGVVCPFRYKGMAENCRLFFISITLKLHQLVLDVCTLEPIVEQKQSKKVSGMLSAKYKGCES